MAKLLHKNKVILNDMRYATNIFEISNGLMFASQKKLKRGICLVMPFRSVGRFSSSVTMLFVFKSLDILFVDTTFDVVDKVTLRPFVFSYTPKKACKFVIEGPKGYFDKISIGDKVSIKQ